MSRPCSRGVAWQTGARHTADRQLAAAATLVVAEPATLPQVPGSFYRLTCRSNLADDMSVRINGKPVKKHHVMLKNLLMYRDTDEHWKVALYQLASIGL